MHACAGSSVTALVERFANTHPSATEAEAMQSGFLFAVAGVDAIGADGRFINNPSLQLMVHLLIDPMRAQMLLDATDVVEARLLGVATPAVHVGPDSQQDDEEDSDDGYVHGIIMQEEEQEEEADEEAEEEEEGFVDTGGEEDEDLSIANEEDVEVEGVVRKAMNFDEEPAAKGVKRLYAQIEELESYIYIYIYTIYAYIHMYKHKYIYIYI